MLRTYKFFIGLSVYILITIIGMPMMYQGMYERGIESRDRNEKIWDECNALKESNAEEGEAYYECLDLHRISSSESVKTRAEFVSDRSETSPIGLIMMTVLLWILVSLLFGMVGGMIGVLIWEMGGGLTKWLKEGMN